jgi:DNA-directed RNA polymerase subunit RPC12/RpoP
MVQVVDGVPMNFENHYVCPECKGEWRDRWDSMCDDDCPHCGARHITPTESVDLREVEGASDDQG